MAQVGDIIQYWGGHCIVYWVDPMDSNLVKLTKKLHAVSQPNNTWPGNTVPHLGNKEILTHDFPGINSSSTATGSAIWGCNNDTGPQIYDTTDSLGNTQTGAAFYDPYTLNNLHMSPPSWPTAPNNNLCNYYSASIWKHMLYFNSGATASWRIPAKDELVELLQVVGPCAGSSSNAYNSHGLIGFVSSTQVSPDEDSLGCFDLNGTQIYDALDGSTPSSDTHVWCVGSNDGFDTGNWAYVPAWNSTTRVTNTFVAKKNSFGAYMVVSGIVDITPPPPPGCTDPLAYNYDPSAVIDDGSCLYCDCDMTPIVNCTQGASATGVADGQINYILPLDPNCTYPLTIKCTAIVGGATVATTVVNAYTSFSANQLVNNVIGGNSYSWTVTDANGCVTGNTTFQVCILQPFDCGEQSPVLDTAIVTNPSLPGASDGNFMVSFEWVNLNNNISLGNSFANGCPLTIKIYKDPMGTPVQVGTTMQISNSSTTQISSGNLDAGQYEIKVEDCNGCTDSQYITLYDPVDPCASITFSSSTTVTAQNTCSTGTNNMGEITISPIWGLSPYTIIQQSGPGSLNVSGVSTYTHSNLADGNYTFKIVDSDGCDYIDTIQLSCVPCSLSVSGTATNPSCAGDKGSYDITSTSTTQGSVTFTYELAGPVSVAPVSGQGGTYTYNSLTAGNYIVYITEDQTGCQDNLSFSITSPPVLVLSGIVSNITMYGLSDGSISLSTTGGNSPYTYAWSNGTTNYNLTGMTAGTYSVTVTDVNGCTINGSYTITEPDCMLMIGGSVTGTSTSTSTDGSINLYNPIGGIPPYTYSWTGPSGFTDTTQDISSLATGYYTINVCDSLGCCESASFYVMPGDCITSCDSDKVLNYLNSILQRCGCDNTSVSSQNLNFSSKGSGLRTSGLRTQFNTYDTSIKIGNTEYSSTTVTNKSHKSLITTPVPSKQLNAIIKNPIFKQEDVSLIKPLEIVTKIADKGYVKDFVKSIKDIVNDGAGYIYKKLVQDNRKFVNTLLNKPITEITKLEKREIEDLQKELDDRPKSITEAINRGLPYSPIEFIVDDVFKEESSSYGSGYDGYTDNPPIEGSGGGGEPGDSGDGDVEYGDDGGGGDDG